MDWSCVPLDRRRNESTNLLLIFSIFGVFTGGDGLSEPGRTLEEHDQRNGSSSGPAVEGVAGICAPLVKYNPYSLFSKEVGVSAVGPETGGDEAAIQVILLETLGNLGSFEVRVLRSLVD